MKGKRILKKKTMGKGLKMKAPLAQQKDRVVIGMLLI